MTRPRHYLAAAIRAAAIVCVAPLAWGAVGAALVAGKVMGKAEGWARMVEGRR